MNLLFVFLQAGGGGDYSFLIMMVAVFVFLHSVQYTRNTIVLTQFVSCFLSYVCPSI
jgi:hypothetical protein